MIEKCPVCEKANSLFKAFIFPTYEIYSCKECLVRFSFPFVHNKEVYDSNFISINKQYLDTVAMSDIAHSTLSPYLNLKGKRILDIGCGTGSFLDNMRADNEVLGVEISEAYKECLEKKGIPHLIGAFDSALLGVPDNYFDLVTLWDVCEHLEDCSKVLAIVKDKLSPHGTIIVWTNNYDDCISKFAETVYRISFGRLGGLIQTSFNRSGGHNYNFVTRTLEELYRKHDLIIVKALITDTPSSKLTDNISFKIILELFYLMNRLLGKGKIVCHVLKKNDDEG